MNKITINNKSHNVVGRNVSVVTTNGVTTIKVDGNIVVEGSLGDQITVKFEGDLANLDCHNVIVNGNVENNVNSHNVECHHVGGDINAHKVNCGKVLGNINAHKVMTND
jgi:hypothetical protein